MPDHTTASANNVATVDKPQSPRLPPDEKFWKRYSPHHEFPLSTVASVAVHVIIGGLIVYLGYYILKLQAKTPLPMEPITIAGGGGNQQGVRNDKGGPLPPHVEAAEKAPQENLPANTTPENDPNLQKAEAKTPELDKNESDALARLLERSRTAVQGFDKVNADTQKKLIDGLRVPGKGQGGGGSGGGKGEGTGPGIGNEAGPGKESKMEQRTKRLLRWRMKFNTLDGNDYRRQLSALGAFLAIPAPGGGGDYEVIENLKPPVRGQIKDLSKINRIFWVDDTPQSVFSLSQALGLRVPPPHIMAFFPIELEEKLADLEKRFKGKSEDKIQETRFEIVNRGGKYEPRVVSQD